MWCIFSVFCIFAVFYWGCFSIYLMLFHVFLGLFFYTIFHNFHLFFLYISMYFLYYCCVFLLFFSVQLCVFCINAVAFLYFPCISVIFPHFSPYLACLVDSQSDGADGYNEDTRGIIMILIVIPNYHTEQLEHVEWIQNLQGESKQKIITLNK